MRRAVPTDISDLVALQRALEAEAALWGYRADFPEDWSKRDLTWTLLAAVDRRTVGFIHCAPRACAGECVFPANAKVLEIVELVVQPAHRGAGLGSQLVSAIKSMATEDGFSHLRLYSASKRFDDITRFYRTCGFTPWYLEMTQDLRSDPLARGPA